MFCVTAAAGRTLRLRIRIWRADELSQILKGCKRASARLYAIVCSMRWRSSRRLLNAIPNVVLSKMPRRYLLNLTLARRCGFKASPRC